MVGLKRLFEEEVEVTNFGLRFDISILEQLPERFFKFMIEEHSIAERDYKRLKNNLEYAQNKDYFKQNLQQIHQLMSEQFKKVKRYFAGDPEHEEISKVIKSVKEIKNIDEIDKLREAVDRYYTLMKTEKINDKLTINFLKATIMRSFFGQVSFLNVNKNKLDKQGHIELYYKDYIKPVFLETKFKELLNGEDYEAIITYLEDNQDYQPFKSLLEILKKKSAVQEMRNYMDEEYPQCTFIDKQFATTNYEEMLFSLLGVSKNNSINFNWDLQKSQPIPLSVLAKLILFLAPVGVAFYNRKDGYANQGEYRVYAGFVLSDEPFPEIVRQNNAFKNKKQKNDPFNLIIYDLLQDIKIKAESVVKQLLFIEIHADYDSKKTLLDYYHMPAYTAQYFKKYGNKLQHIRQREYIEAFTRTALRGIEPKQEVFRYLRTIINSSSPGVGPFIAVRELNRLQALKRGAKEMEKEDKKIYVVFRQGQEIREKLIYESEYRSAKAEGDYTASGNKKVNAIAYRLLNAAKAGNKKSFMDTLFRIHMAAGKEISPIFLNALHEKELKFETIASGFIAGLLSPKFDSQKEKEVL